MYCNSCLKQIPKDDDVYCVECGVPLHSKCANHCLECGDPLCDSCYAENKFRCSKCFDVKKPIKAIRRSYIKQYEQCPYSLYLMLIEGIEPPMGKYAQLGIIVHKIIEEMQLEKITEKQALIRLEEEVMEWDKNNDDEYSLIPLDLLEVGKNCITEFERERPMLIGETKLEYKIQYSIDEKLPDITCTLDRIAFVNNDIHIHDWKTGKPLAGKNLIKELQPPLYIYAIYKEFGVMPKTFNLHYLNKGKILTYKYIDDEHYEISTSRSKYILDIPKAIERTKKILNGIKKEKWDIPSDVDNNWYCKRMCWYGISGMCKGNQIEEWHKVNKERENAKKEERKE